MINTDKTCVVQMTGGAQAYPMYASLGNIHSDVRSKYGAEAWKLVAYLPIPEWVEQDNEIRSALSARLYHECMSIFAEPLVKLARSPEMWTDPNGLQRLVIPVLMSMPLDHPEQLLVACVRASASPISEAITDEFGRPSPAPLRRGRDTLKLLRRIAEKFDKHDLPVFIRECKRFDLLGVPDPFWGQLWGADPCKFLSTDMLHIFHVFFRDNLLKWIKSMAKSKSELNFRHQIQPHHVGVRHFHNGVTKLQKCMGTEVRALENILITASRGIPGISKQASAALRAISDVIFICRYPSHSDGTIALLEDALKRFHSHKPALVACGARKSPKFNLPKLEKMQHIPQHIRQLGAVQQYSTEVTEHAHQEACSQPYASSNHKDYLDQMARYRDRLEKVKLAPDYVLWKTAGMRSSCRDDHSDGDCTDEEVNELQDLAYVVQVHDFFASGHNPQLRRYIFNEVAIRLTPRRPTPLYSSIDHIIEAHGTKSFYSAFYHFQTDTRRAPPSGYELPFCSVIAWSGLRLQRRSVHNPSILVPPVTVKAAPISAQRPWGQFDTVLICTKDTETVGLAGSLYESVSVSRCSHLVIQAMTLFSSALSFTRFMRTLHRQLTMATLLFTWNISSNIGKMGR